VKIDTLHGQPSPELAQWLMTSLNGGCLSHDMVNRLVGSGYEPNYARHIVDWASLQVKHTKPKTVQSNSSTEDGNAEKAGGQDDALSISSSEILAQNPNTLQIGGRDIRVLMALNEPRIVLFGNLMSPDECAQLIGLAKERVARSSVVNPETGVSVVHSARTSSGTHFRRNDHILIAALEDRICELLQLPISRFEPLQILNYQVGAEYRAHYDYFDSQNEGYKEILSHGGQRIATLVMYLNAVEAGGATTFPLVGLDILPQPGQGVYFAYTSSDGEVDKRTLHGGSPVTQGEKWIATFWMRQSDYSQR